ncbi:hypothetical protein [Streptomyces sp. NPDC059080]
MQRKRADSGAWLETTASFADRADELADAEAAAPLVEPAAHFARLYLRQT